MFNINDYQSISYKGDISKKKICQSFEPDLANKITWTKLDNILQTEPNMGKHDLPDIDLAMVEQQLAYWPLYNISFIEI